MRGSSYLYDSPSTPPESSVGGLDVDKFREEGLCGKDWKFLP